MTEEQEKLIKKAIVLNAQFYGLELSASVLALYMQDLEDLPAEAILDAYRAYRQNPVNKTSPLPAQIRALIKPQANSRQIAQEIANRCFGAIRRFGYTKPQQARAFIGELGWRLIERRGGWVHHCQNTMESDIPILTAQFRDAISSYAEQKDLPDDQYFQMQKIEFTETAKLLNEMPKAELLSDDELMIKRNEAIKKLIKT